MKIDQYDVATSLSDNDKIPLELGGGTHYVTYETLRDQIIEESVPKMTEVSEEQAESVFQSYSDPVLKQKVFFYQGIKLVKGKNLIIPKEDLYKLGIGINLNRSIVSLNGIYGLLALPSSNLNQETGELNNGYSLQLGMDSNIGIFLTAMEPWGLRALSIVITYTTTLLS